MVADLLQAQGSSAHWPRGLAIALQLGLIASHPVGRDGRQAAAIGAMLEAQPSVSATD